MPGEIIVSEPDEIASVDLVADEAMQVEVQHEVGTEDKYKLYVHYLGRTIIRICKLREEQFAIAGMRPTALVSEELVTARTILADILLRAKNGQLGVTKDQLDKIREVFHEAQDDLGTT